MTSSIMGTMVLKDTSVWIVIPLRPLAYEHAQAVAEGQGFFAKKSILSMFFGLSWGLQRAGLYSADGAVVISLLIPV